MKYVSIQIHALKIVMYVRYRTAILKEFVFMTKKNCLVAVIFSGIMI